MTDTKNKRAHLISLGKIDVPTDGTWRDTFGLFKLWLTEDDPQGIIPQIIAARCLGISYGDPGPKLDEKACRECWGDRHVWLGNVWGLKHQNDTRTLECKHECHDDEVWVAEA